MAIPQGSLKLLDTEIAKKLLSSTIPARLAYIAKDGTPRVIPTWFHWNGQEIVMATFIAGPQVSHPPARPAALRKHPNVAITIDTETFPLMCFSLGGKRRSPTWMGLSRNSKRRLVAIWARRARKVC
jgi:hypothetical protein